MRLTHITRFQSLHHVTAPPWSRPSFFIYHWPMTTTTALAISSLPIHAYQTQFDITPQYSDQWFALRRERLTSSTFSTALGFWRGNRRSELWHEKVFPSHNHPSKMTFTDAMHWGMDHEETAKARYCSIMGREVGSLGLAIHSNQNLSWLAASPDGLLGSHGILEVKCPYNKGNTKKAPWSTVPFYYMPQLQGLMEITGRDWVDVFCWTVNGSTMFRVERNRPYWDLMEVILREFWWENVVPARVAVENLEDGMSYEPSAMHKLINLKDVMSYEPSAMHELTKKALYHSYTLVKEIKLMCRESCGRAEFTHFFKELC